MRVKREVVAAEITHKPAIANQPSLKCHELSTSIQTKDATSSTFKSRANPTARTRPAVKPPYHNCGSPGQRYVAHDILPIRSRLLAPECRRPPTLSSDKQPRNSNSWIAP